MRLRTALPWLLAATTLIVGVAGIVLGAIAGGSENSPALMALGGAVVLTPAVVGFVLARRRPDNAIGWIVAGNGLTLAVLILVETYASYAADGPSTPTGGAWAALVANSDWPLLFAGPLALALLFPDGRLPSPRWRRVAVAIAVVFALVVVASLLSPDPFSPPYEDIENPLPTLPSAVVGWALAPLLLGLLASFVAAFLAVRTRYRRGSPVERAQVLWFAYAAALLPLALLVCLVLGAAGASPDDPVLIAIFTLQIAMPVAIAVAVLRYRLYEIDRIVNRTVVYVALTAVLAAAWGVTVVLLGVALGGGSPWATAGATLVAAVAFRPVRARIQDLVDRRFDRRRYDAVRRVEAFLHELREDRAQPEAIGDVLAQALGDAALEVAFWLPESGIHADAEGRTVEPRAGPGRAIAPVTRGGAPLGVVVHDARLAERLLEPVLQSAGLAFEIARLRVELRRQLAEVELSRARIVVAGYEERRRIERDLHDGAQQRLVTVGLALRHLQHALPPSANGLGAGLDEAVAEVGAAIADLRELARGVRPSLLDEGLEPALRQLADRCPVPVLVDVTPDRLEPDIEAAAYFVASEALTNAVKHGGPSRITVRATHDDGRLTVSVGDDGRGGAAASPGSGLAGLADRVAAHGGSLRVTSPPSSGTTVVAELPCGS